MSLASVSLVSVSLASVNLVSLSLASVVLQASVSLGSVSLASVSLAWKSLAQLVICFFLNEKLRNNEVKNRATYMRIMQPFLGRATYYNFFCNFSYVFEFARFLMS